MKVNGIDFNFGRMLKVELINPGARGNREVACTIEYCPYDSADKCPRIEAKVTDLPSADSNDYPGYTAEVKIYNPNRKIIELIAQNAKWLLVPDKNSYSNASPEKKVKITTNNLQDYYAQRLQMRVYAGYWDNDTKAAGYKEIFCGYVNGSSLTHNGTDDILTIGAHDINVNRMDVNAITASLLQAIGLEHETEWKIKNRNWYKGAASWDLTFKKYVRFFETEKLQNGKIVSKTFADSGSDSWFRVLYVKSVKDYLNARAANFSNNNYLAGWLRTQLAQVPNAYNGPGEDGNMRMFYTNGRNLPAMLDQLCAVDGLKLGWKRYILGEDKLTYIVYPLGEGIKFGPIEKGDIVIYNYQNLLATPSVNGAGCLNIKMMFNPECIPWRRIALQLEPLLGKEQGVADIKSFETAVRVNGKIVGVMDASSSLFTSAATNQITGTQIVAAQNKVDENGLADGYMFNTGFPITKVVHTLSTHDTAWHTQVTTVPMVRGIDMEAKNG